MTSVSMTPTARDVTISFNDSCNGCCWCCKKPPDEHTRVYIDSKGEARVFSPRKARDDREAMRRAISNLHKRIEEVASHLEKDPDETIRDIERIARINITERSSQDPITLGMVGRINTAIHTMKEESRRSKTSGSEPSVGSPPPLGAGAAGWEPGSPKEKEKEEDPGSPPHAVELERKDSHRPSSFPSVSKDIIEVPKTETHKEEIPENTRCVLS